MTNDQANSCDVGLLGQRENVTFRSQRLAAVPSDLLTMHNLLIVDLSHNQITRFPGDLFVQDVPRLEVLNLQHNLLYVLEDILALSVAPRLRELNVASNPLRLLDNRIYFLEALFGSAVCDAKALRMVHKDMSLTAKVLSTPSATGVESTRAGTKAKKRATRTMMLMQRLPRRTGFPMLQRLNGLWIMDDEIRAVERERGCALEYYIPRYGATAAHRPDNTGGRAISSKYPSSSPEKLPGAPNGRRFDGSRMTAMEQMKKSSRSAAIPEATVIQRFQIDVDNNTVIQHNEHSSDDQELSDQVEGGEEAHEVIHRLFAQDTTTRNAPLPRRPGTAEMITTDEMPWNYPVRSFDTLASDERQYIRHRSKQSVESNLQRDDHFFDSSIYLDCIAQAERSRRLTIRAVDTLCPLPRTSLSSPCSVPSFESNTAIATPTSSAAAKLRETLSTKFTKESDDAAYQKIEAFLRNPQVEVEGSARDRMMQGALSELFLTEHVEHRQQTRQLLAAQDADTTANVNPLDVVAAQLDDSLSRTKLRNAVDLANAMLLNKKQEKRMMQMLIDADARAIEEERAALEQALHRHRLDLIASNTFYATEQIAHEADREWMAKVAKRTTPSPWQARNWRAKEARRRSMLNNLEDKLHRFETKADHDRAPSSPRDVSSVQTTRDKSGKFKAVTKQMTKRPASASLAAHIHISKDLDGEVAVSASAKFRSIETVEQAARDTLDHVDSHDLLVRCAAIRQHTHQHTQSLADFRDKFLEEEAAWELMRQDPINIVRRHLRRKLYQDAQEIQIAGTQLFYSSLFQQQLPT